MPEPLPDPPVDEPAAPPKPRLRLWLSVAVFNLVVVLVLLALLEGVLALCLAYPPPIQGVRRLFAGYYTRVERVIIQFLPDCARYDNELSYTLRPGSCRFANWGFDTRVDVNAAGVRDDAPSLRAPEVIVLGDSHAMGWGVEAPEAFPARVERQCRAKVLNAGISSYGTAREMGLLRRLDTSGLKWLVIQYGRNDRRENFEFHQRGNQLSPMPLEDYQRFQRMVLANQGYYPGRQLLRFLPYLAARVRGHSGDENAEGMRVADGRSSAPAAPRLSEAELFLNALRSAPALPPGTRVVVIELSGRMQHDGSFPTALGKAIQAGEVPEPWRSMIVLDPGERLSIDAYLPLDEHMAPEGHEIVSRELAAAMGCPAPPR